jgi:hypothetical protein
MAQPFRFVLGRVLINAQITAGYELTSRLRYGHRLLCLYSVLGGMTVPSA